MATCCLAGLGWAGLAGLEGGTAGLEGGLLVMVAVRLRAGTRCGGSGAGLQKGR